MGSLPVDVALDEQDVGVGCWPRRAPAIGLRNQQPNWVLNKQYNREWGLGDERNGRALS